GEPAVEILMQGVPAAFGVAQEERRRTRLARGVTAGEVVVERGRKIGVAPERGGPRRGDRSQVPVERAPQRGDGRGERVREVAVSALAETARSHVDGLP